VRFRTYKDEDDELTSLLLHNQTRNKTTEQQTREGKVWEEIEAKKAQGRQKGGVKISTLAAPCGQRNQSSNDTSSNELSIKGRTSDFVAKKVGLGSGDGYERAKKVVQTIDTFQAQGNLEKAYALRRVLNSDSITAAYKLAKWPEPKRDKALQLIAGGQARNFRTAKIAIFNASIDEQLAELKSNPPQLPAGKFDVIAIDPPWPYENSYNPEWGRTALPYPEMPLAEIRQLTIPAADDCILFLWTTNKFLPDSYPLLIDWGFRYVALITWVKGEDEDHVRLGMGKWLRSQTEHVLMAVKGKPHHKIDLTDQGTVLFGKPRQHSRKPETFYQMVEGLCPSTRKLDYFSRDPRDGWEQFGNDIGKFSRASETQGATAGGDDNE
jgi:N6-adenosine-specific RNA methylase IME4